MPKHTYWIYDIETFPNVFTMTITSMDRKVIRKFHVSQYENDIDKIYKCLDWLHENGHYMVGFNNIGFDYPVLHKVLHYRNLFTKSSGIRIAEQVYRIAMEQIASARGGFPETVAAKDEYVRQVDLFKIHHFDNKAKSTSLKLLQFNMRSDTIEEMPFDVGTVLTKEQADVLLEYNLHDVLKTADFFDMSLPMIEFREQLTEKYDRNFMNHNDTKIGKDYFVMELERQGIPTKKRVGSKTVTIQTPRDVIRLSECIFDYYDFNRPEFLAIVEWFKAQRIVETKGVFTELDEHDLGPVFNYCKYRTRRVKIKCESNDGPSDEELAPYIKLHPKGWVEKVQLNAKFPKYLGGHYKNAYWFNWNEADVLNVVVDGFQFDFGVGGIHGSISETVCRSTTSWMIIDADVSSMYPNLGISNRVYPEHLTERFCDIYQDVYEQRKSYKKGTAENAMLKLALNGVYGDSNNKFGPFYDPMYTMKITINGQLSLCLLAEKLMDIPEIRFIQINTDGITVAIRREHEEQYKQICADWQKQVNLELEFAYYDKMIIRDVNNYLAIYTDGKVKRKGAYQYEGLGWHQNQSALVIQKAAEAHMLHGMSIEDYIRNHKDPFDFMMRAKMPKSARLQMEYADGSVVPQQRICRYYPAKNGGQLIKIMPPLPSKSENGERRFKIEKGQLVKTCNNMVDFDWDIDYDYYIREAEKLIVGKKTSIEEEETTEENDD